MTNEQHPITPPTELVTNWTSLACEEEGWKSWDSIATQAAQWGADQELEACCEWAQGYAECGDSLRAARRPKPPSLKEQALDALQSMRISPELIAIINANTDLKDKYETIRSTLEALPND